MIQETRRGLLARATFAAAFATAIAGFSTAHAASIPVSGNFAPFYTAESYNGPTSLPTLYGGLTFLAGDPNTILIGGSANNSNGAIYSIPVSRDGSGHINGFGQATFYASAPYIDGGLTYGPNGVLFYTAYPTHQIGQIAPGGNAPARVDAVVGISGSVGSLNFVPAGYPNAGALVVASYNSNQWGTATVTPDGNGTFNISSIGNVVTIPGGPEGFIYIDAGNPEFNVQSMLVAEYALNRISAYEIDADGLPILSTRRDFITGLTGAEGAAIDPLTGDFLFSTFGGGNQLVVVQGFNAPPPIGETPLPAAFALFPAGLGAIALIARRRKRAAA